MEAAIVITVVVLCAAAVLAILLKPEHDEECIPCQDCEKHGMGPLEAIHHWNGMDLCDDCWHRRQAQWQRREESLGRAPVLKRREAK